MTFHYQFKHLRIAPGLCGAGLDVEVVLGGVGFCGGLCGAGLCGAGLCGAGLCGSGVSTAVTLGEIFGAAEGLGGCGLGG